jgi:hypothetical protein
MITLCARQKHKNTSVPPLTFPLLTFTSVPELFVLGAQMGANLLQGQHAPTHHRQAIVESDNIVLLLNLVWSHIANAPANLKSMFRHFIKRKFFFSLADRPFQLTSFA